MIHVCCGLTFFGVQSMYHRIVVQYRTCIDKYTIRGILCL